MASAPYAAKRFHIVAWTRMTTYKEDVDSERMHLDEGRVYELNVVFDEMLNEALRDKMQRANPPAMMMSNESGTRM